jgi:glucan endo-1,3-alpha-glucosidase
MPRNRRAFLTAAASASAAGLALAPLQAMVSGPSHGTSSHRKLAFAHYMTGQATRRRKHTIEDWKDDIRDAIAYGIDGWQFNFGHYLGHFKENIERFVEALGQMGPEAANFRFFPSFDCNKRRIPEYAEVHEWFSRFHKHPQHFRLNDLPLLTVWQARHVGNSYFADLKQRLQVEGLPVSFIPWLAVRPNQVEMDFIFAEWQSMDGFFPWVPGRPVEEAVRYNEIAANLCRKHGKTLLAGQGFAMLQANKAPVYVNKHAAEAITKQMMPLIDGRVDCTLLNVATWNDFGEDHHVTPQPPYGPQGGKHPVWGHVGYATVLKYYLDWWKTGKKPALEQDRLVIFHMAQLAKEGQPPFSYASYAPDKAEDVVHVTAMLRAPGSIVVTSGRAVPVRFEVPAGISHWQSSASPGAQSFSLFRGNTEILRRTSAKQISSPPDGPWSWSLHSEVATGRVPS